MMCVFFFLGCLLQPPVTYGPVWMTWSCPVCSPGLTNTWWPSLIGLQGNLTTTMGSVKTVLRCYTRWGGWQKYSYTPVKYILYYRYKLKVYPAWKNSSCPHYSFVAVDCDHFVVDFTSVPDWPMERRVLYRAQYLHMQKAQSTLPCALCKTHCVRMPPGRTNSNHIFNFSLLFKSLDPSYDVCWKKATVHVENHSTHLCNLCQGWDAYGYSCYWMEETTRTWSDAKAFCKEKDGFLLHIGDMWVILQNKEMSICKKPESEPITSHYRYISWSLIYFG